MARNGSGVYTLPEPAFVPNTPISSAAVNNDLSDIANALTGSVAADGQTTMSGALKMDNSGAVYASDPNTGIRRTAGDTQAVFSGGVDTLVVSATGVAIAGTMDATVVRQAGQPLFPPGAVTAYTNNSSIPSGWLKCDGSNVSRTTFAALFSVIGTTFGSGDGSTTFGLPNTTGRPILGMDPSQSVVSGFTTMGATSGAESRVLTTANLPAYTPSGALSVPLFGGSNSVNNIVQTNGILDNAYGTPGIPIYRSANSIVLSTAGSTFTGNAQGGVSQSFSVVQPSLALIYIIKT